MVCFKNVTLHILAALASFQRVATTLNFSMAARQLNLSPAALSITIKKLEERLGTRLFERTTRSVRLTDAGRDYWERIAPLLNDINAATEDLQVQASAEGGVLRLTLGHVTGPLLIEPLLAEFLAQYPAIRIELFYEDRFVDIVNKKIVEFSVDGPLVVNHWSSAINAAISGIGLCHLVKESAAQAIAQGQLVEVLSKFSPSFDGFYFYYPRRDQMPKKTRVFLDFLRKQLRSKSRGDKPPPVPTLSNR
jgi:DNA-binding transcriptional LysR family regulator